MKRGLTNSQTYGIIKKKEKEFKWFRGWELIK